LTRALADFKVNVEDIGTLLLCMTLSRFWWSADLRHLINCRPKSARTKREKLAVDEQAKVKTSQRRGCLSRTPLGLLRRKVCVAGRRRVLVFPSATIQRVAARLEKYGYIPRGSPCVGKFDMYVEDEVRPTCATPDGRRDLPITIRAERSPVSACRLNKPSTLEAISSTNHLFKNRGPTHRPPLLHQPVNPR